MARDMARNIKARRSRGRDVRRQRSIASVKVMKKPAQVSLVNAGRASKLTTFIIYLELLPKYHRND